MNWYVYVQLHTSNGEDWGLISLDVAEILWPVKYGEKSKPPKSDHSWEVFWKLGVLEFSVKILEKYLWRSSFLVKLQADSLQFSVVFPEVFTQ